MCSPSRGPLPEDLPVRPNLHPHQFGLARMTLYTVCIRESNYQKGGTLIPRRHLAIIVLFIVAISLPYLLVHLQALMVRS